ncbi:hypothetical protein P7C71_g6153, partial [Lecanoromycetidae sp. Uapishka_2]
MKVRNSSPSRLTDFKLLSFDCFGTLVDWESGIYSELQLLLDRLPTTHPLRHDRALAIERFNDLEIQLCASEPGLLYSSLLAGAYIKLAEELGLPAPAQTESDAVGASIGKWPAFSDTVEALNRLKKHYKLVILSNVDQKSFQEVLEGPLREVKFDAVYTAEEIGSYKPDLKNFHYLLDHVREGLGVEKEHVLHTAHGLKSDHVPAKEMGMNSAWIARGDGMGEAPKLEAVKDDVAFTWRFEDMKRMADNADEEFDRSGR